MDAGDDVRAEAARLRARLEVASHRLDGAARRPDVAADRLDALTAGGPRPGGDDDDNDDVDPRLRALLHPSADRVSHLIELAGSLADGTMTDTAVAEAARAIADSQPVRRPR